MEPGVVAAHRFNISVKQSFNPDKTDMGSTTFGNVIPMIGPAMPATFRFDRVGPGCVRMDGCT